MAKKAHLMTSRRITFLNKRKTELLRTHRRFSIKKTSQSLLMLNSKKYTNIKRSGLSVTIIIDASNKRD